MAMAKKSKAKRHSVVGTLQKKKRAVARKKAIGGGQDKSLAERRAEAALRHAAATKTEPHPPKPPHIPFVPVASMRAAVSHGKKKSKKKHAVTLRFTENTLRDIAALECVRRCFR